MVAELCAGAKTGASEIGFATTLSQVAPTGHFFAAPQTMERYKSAFYEPVVHEYSNFGTWSERGAEDATTRATKVWQGILSQESPIMIDGDRKDRLRAFIEARTAEGGAPPVS